MRSQCEPNCTKCNGRGVRDGKQPQKMVAIGLGSRPAHRLQWQHNGRFHAEKERCVIARRRSIKTYDRTKSFFLSAHLSRSRYLRTRQNPNPCEPIQIMFELRSESTQVGCGILDCSISISLNRWHSPLAATNVAQQTIFAISSHHFTYTSLRAV